MYATLLCYAAVSGALTRELLKTDDNRVPQSSALKGDVVVVFWRRVDVRKTKTNKNKEHF